MTDRRDLPAWAFLLLCLLSGGSLFLSDYPVHAWPIQAVALVPWLYALVRGRPRWWKALLAGFLLGTSYTGPLLWVLAFPLGIGLVLAGYLTTLWMILSLGAAWLLRRPSALSALAVAGLATVVEWVNISLLPFWGTAQTFTRVWSAWPAGVQLVAITGVTGLVFVLVAVQALGVVAVAHPAARRRAVSSLGALVTVVVVASLLVWPRHRLGTVRVAAVGWCHRDLPRGDNTSALRVYRETYLPLLRAAVRQGAELVVSPETAFYVRRYQRAAFLAQVDAEARAQGVMLAVGWFDGRDRRNRIRFVDGTGRGVARYVKTHLIMTLEKYHRGDGTLAVTRLRKRWALGGMVCQDDNFTDLSRGYGRRGVHLLAVPTNDWDRVAPYHLENSLFRAVESRYAIVRAATNGISVIATARGEVLARADHFKTGPALIVADLPLYEPGSLYARAGDWVVWLSVLLLLVVAGFQLRRRHPERGRDR